MHALAAFLSENEGSLAEKTLRSGAWVGISSGIARLLKFVRAVILARLLAPADFGLMAIVLVFTRGFDIVSQPGFSAAIIHRTDRVKEAVDVAWGALIARGALSAGIVFAAAPVVATFYEEPALVSLIRAIACIFLIQGLSNSHLILLRKEMDFKRLTLFEVVTAVLELVVVVAVAWVYRSVWALIIGQILHAVLRVIVSFCIVPDRPRLSFDRRLLGELFRYGKFITGATTLMFLSGNIDNAVVGKVLGMDALGYYALAFGLASLPTTNIAPVITKVMFPAFSKLKGSLPALRQAYLKLVRVVATVTLPMACGIAVLAPEIVRVVYGARWLPMVAPVYVLCVFGGLQAFSVSARPVFDGSGKPHFNFYVLCLRIALIAVSVYPLTSRYGIVGTAVAVAAPALIEQLILWLLMARLLRCSIAKLLGSAMPAALATALMVSVLLAIRPQIASLSAGAQLALRIGVGTVLYLGTVVAIDRVLVGDTNKHFRRLLAPRRRER